MQTTEMININKDALTIFIRTHLYAHFQETLSQELISKLIGQIVDSFDYFLNSQAE